MAVDDPRFLWGRLFIAVPEMARDQTLLEHLLTSGFITRKEHDDYLALGRTFRRARRVTISASGKSLIERLLTVAPELFSVQTIDLLRRFELLTDLQGHQYRTIARALGAFSQRTGKSTGVDSLIIRISRALGSAISFESIDLALMQGRITHDQAQQLRAGLLAGRRGRNIVVNRMSTKPMQVLQLLGNELFNKDIARAMMLAGVISRRDAAIFNVMVDLGPTIWRTTRGVYEAEGYAQRLLVGAVGVLDNRTIDAMLDLKLLNQKQAALLRPAVGAARALVRSAVVPYGKGQRYRPVAGESPIKTFARISRTTDRELLTLLARAAKENAQFAEDLIGAPTIGARVRGGQAKIAQAQLYRSMHDMYEDLGHLIIRGEYEAAQAAYNSMHEIQSKVWKRGGKPLTDLDRVLRAQGAAGVDAFISRQENVVALSRLVYKNRDLALGVVNKRINLALLRGQSAQEAARDIARLIRPDVPGGISYAAMRLARTEINNAFHYESIRATREMPWVTGYKWHTSNSHPEPDICNTYANKPPFRKTEVPAKPHPHCLCYITPETVDPETFDRNLRKGQYNRYLKTQAVEAEVSEPGGGVAVVRAAAAIGGGFVARKALVELASRIGPGGRE